MDATEALIKIQEAVKAQPLRVSFWDHALERGYEKNVTRQDVLRCLRSAHSCRQSEDAPDRWVVEGLDLSDEPLKVIVRLVQVLVLGARCEVVTLY